MYIVLNTYSSTLSCDMTMLNMENSTCTLTNVYTNNTSFTTIGTITGSATTSFLFNSAPTFASPNGFQSFTSGPNLITVFTTTPFLSSAYTTFDSIAEFSTSSPVSVPCLCRGMKILTPSGPIAVECLKEGDLLLAPPFNNRTVQIQRVFFSTYVGTKENVPYRIPAHFFEQSQPNEDILLSPHHAIFYNGKWLLPCHIDGLQPEVSMIGDTFEYYHVRLPEYYSDKLSCHNLPVDSWDDSDSSMDPLNQEATAASTSTSTTTIVDHHDSKTLQIMV